MRIESIHLRNYKTFREAILEDIPPMSVVVGANGSGKSTLFVVFGFLKDCLTFNVSRALASRGGFKELVSRGRLHEPVEIKLQYRLLINDVSRLVTYILKIAERDNTPFVLHEELHYKRGRYGRPSAVLNFAAGAGKAVVNEDVFNDADEKLQHEHFELDSSSLLAIKGLGQLHKFKAASALRHLIENWFVSDFHIDAARGAKDAVGFEDHLSVSGDNLQLVARNLYENHRSVFDRICKVMSDRVPGVSSVEPKATDDGKILLRFGDAAFKDPFVDRYVSDGTMRMFAYLVLLHDPNPHPLLCVEEPENQLYVSLLPELAEEFRAYAQRGGQVFVSTHSPDFLNAAELEEVFWLVKENGFSKVLRAQDDQQIRVYYDMGDKLGYLWKQGLLAGVDPS